MKVLYAASFGGHWVQLKRISALIANGESVFVTTRSVSLSESCLVVRDFSLKSFYIGFLEFSKIFGYIRRENPDVLLSTGAAPGLLVLFCGCLLGKRTIWIDSIANSKRLSLSGRVAKSFCSLTLTQWPDLASRHNGVCYFGRLL